VRLDVFVPNSAPIAPTNIANLAKPILPSLAKLTAKHYGRLMVDITEQLRDDRKKYVELRKSAVRFVALYSNSDMGETMSEQCRILDKAIANIDVALKLSGEG
jgi:hypothetical protein